MPTIEHEGRTYVLKVMKLKCLKCGTVAETSHPYPHHAYCECRAVHIDGGISMGATVTGNPWAMEDLSIFRTEQKPKVELPSEVVVEHHQKLREMMIESYRNQGSSEEYLEKVKLGQV